MGTSVFLWVACRVAARAPRRDGRISLATLFQPRPSSSALQQSMPRTFKACSGPIRGCRVIQDEGTYSRYLKQLLSGLCCVCPCVRTWGPQRAGMVVNGAARLSSWPCLPPVPAGEC
ncbi:uncharacterized protein LY79DRAFT_545858 [Colletotrichum navitas]|uniref:Uncharacterized protein n=1 Tax=Colletotrichum navitas TaxID=681940 RepID=A0AAD8V676_9PEZI|nr:uncharacterized protein LY79DRAFT_545858 [Colletotrichum navitas]KAK1595727.1 hypothetical protein LY79DRAFT_545858 [Colletotrichum navitas]